jgi:hypothetical protein
MPKSKFLLVLALLLLLAVPTTVVMSDGHGLGEGTATVFDDAGMSDGLEVSLTGASAPDAGKEYAVWLVAEQQTAFLRVGTLGVGDDGSASLTFDSSSDGHSGDNLVATYSGWAISIEDAGSSPASPSNQGEASEVFEGDMLGNVRDLVMSMSGLRAQLELASMHAGFAAESDTVEDVMKHSHHVVNILEGSDGANYDDSHGDPGDGTGALGYAAMAKAAAAAVGGSGEEGSKRAMYSAMANTSAANAEMYAMMARDAALSAAAQDDVDLAKIFVGPGGRTAISLLEAAMYGFDSDGDNMVEGDMGEGGAMSAYRQAQMAVSWTVRAGGLPVLAIPTPPPVPTATPVPPTPAPTPTPAPPQPTAPGLPGVGDETVSPVILMAIMAAAALLVIGGVVSIKDRARRSRNRP